MSAVVEGTIFGSKTWRKFRRKASGRNVRVPEPLLDFRNVRLVLKGIGAGRGSEGMSAHAVKINATLLGVVNGV